MSAGRAAKMADLILKHLEQRHLSCIEFYYG